MPLTILRIIALVIYITVCSTIGIITLPFDRNHNIYFWLSRVFPGDEGTRSKDGEVHEFKRGAFYLAVKVKHPIVPVTLVGSRERANAGGKFKIVPGTVYVHYDKPIYPPEGNIGKKEELELMATVRNKIIENKERMEREYFGR
ncbi:MAG: 1-acyl-sn-glycerol-3-phosphate acyltransferase [Ignavibacteriales bacterium]|nr:1-acyl-sn-glycerol-3-phosphate acyltransferase [Ignavibacteriales bacterium]